MTPEQIEEGFKKEYDSFEEVFVDDGDFAKHFFKAGVEFAEKSVIAKHSLTEEEARRLIEPYADRVLSAHFIDYQYDAVGVSDVITLLMEHSNPPPVLEEAIKRINDRIHVVSEAKEKCSDTNGTEYQHFNAKKIGLEIARQIITELSKGK